MKSTVLGIRNKRYRVKAPQDFKLLIAFPTGSQAHAKLVNCSLHGMRVDFTKTDIDFELTPGMIFPSAKLMWEESEIALGRLVAHNISNDQETLSLGVSLIDSKFPVDGHFSKYLEIEMSDNNPYSFELGPEEFSMANFLAEENSNVDLFVRMEVWETFLRSYKKHAKFGYYTKRLASKGPRINLDLRRSNGRNDFLNLTGYDYLNLAADTRLSKASEEAQIQYGYSTTGSPLLSGLTDLHQKLSDTLAYKTKQEAAILFTTGFSANLGTIGAISGPRDLIVADMLAHASIQDGIRYSQSTARFHKHNDLKHLEQVLKNNRHNHAGCLVVTESVFSMNGNIARLDEVIDIAHGYNARVMVDEAHAFGVLGPHAVGASDLYGCLSKVDIYMGVMSKALGVTGGFVSGRKPLIDYLAAFSRPYMFSGSLSTGAVAASLAALNIIEQEPQRRGKLKDNIEMFVSGLRELGYPINVNHCTPIVPLIIGDEKKVGVVKQELWDSGIFAVPVVYPAVSKTQCRIRFSINSALSVSDIDLILMVLRRALHKAGVEFDENSALAV